MFPKELPVANTNFFFRFRKDNIAFQFLPPQKFQCWLIRELHRDLPVLVGFQNYISAGNIPDEIPNYLPEVELSPEYLFPKLILF